MTHPRLTTTASTAHSKSHLSNSQLGYWWDFARRRVEPTITEPNRRAIQANLIPAVLPPVAGSDGTTFVAVESGGLLSDAIAAPGNDEVVDGAVAISTWA